MTGDVARIAGLDLSTTRIGYAAPNDRLTSIVAHAGPDDPYRRLAQLREGFWHAYYRNPPTPTLVVIEGYLPSGGRTSGPMSRIRLGEIGGLIRTDLFDRGIRFVDVNPSTLKRFATGAGGGDRASKEKMIAAAVAKLHTPANHDEADAFHLRRMGLAAHGQIRQLTDWELDAVAAVDRW